MARIATLPATRLVLAPNKEKIDVLTTCDTKDSALLIGPEGGLSEAEINNSQ